MSITYDDTLNVARISYHDESAGTNALRSAPYSTSDFFDDNATVEDAVYFHIYSPCVPYHNLYVNVGTQLVADSITVAWEYPKEGVWTAIPGVTDNTNAFRVAGANSITFAVPEDMSYSASSFYWTNFPTTEDDLMIRCRITAVTNITEGGANQTTTPYVNNHTITATNEATLTMTDIYNADVGGGWGVVTKGGTNQYFVNCSFRLSASNLVSVKEQIEFGSDTYRVGIGGNGTSSWRFGSKNSEGFGYEGSAIKLWTKYCRGTALYNISVYGSVMWKDLGAWTSPQLAYIVDIRDSTLAGDYWYFTSSITSPSYFHRSVYACSYFFYCYTGNMAIDNLYMPYNTVSCDGVLLGSGNARVDNLTLLNAQNFYRYYGCNVTAVNCWFQDTNWTSEGSGYAFKLNNSPTAGTDWFVKVYFTFDLTVVDEEGDAISGANVILTDGQGNVVFGGAPYAVQTVTDVPYGAMYPMAIYSDTIYAFANGYYYMKHLTGAGAGHVGLINLFMENYDVTKEVFGVTGGNYAVGDTFVVTKELTNSSGKIPQQECLVWHAYIDADNAWARENIDYKDYTLKIQKNGYEDYEFKWNFRDSREVDLKITLKKKPCNSQHTSALIARSV